jgi:hypothetical protein
LVAINSSRLRPLITKFDAELKSSSANCSASRLSRFTASIVVLVVTDDQLLRHSPDMLRVTAQGLHCVGHANLPPLRPSFAMHVCYAWDHLPGPSCPRFEIAGRNARDVAAERDRVRGVAGATTVRTGSADCSHDVKTNA